MCVRVGWLFPLDPAGCRFDKLEIECAGETADDLVLGSGKSAPVGVETLGPDVTAGRSIDELDVDANPISRPRTLPSSR